MFKIRKIALWAVTLAAVVTVGIGLTAAPAQAASLIDATTSAAITAGNQGIQDTIKEWIVDNYLIILGAVVILALFKFGVFKMPNKAIK